MKHIVKISAPWEADRTDGQEVIQVRCALPDAGNLVLALCLLREGLVGSFVILGPKGQKLEVVLNHEQHVHATLKRSGDRVEIGLSPVSVDMVINFYLIYHRDGLADVSHVDIEIATGGYLTFFAADVKPPISASDLEEHLRR